MSKKMIVAIAVTITILIVAGVLLIQRFTQPLTSGTLDASSSERRTEGSVHVGAPGSGDQEQIITDRDYDGLSDEEEISSGTDPDKDDTDGDGLLDGAEVKYFKTDPKNPDSDNDGMPDNKEVRR